MKKEDLMRCPLCEKRFQVTFIFLDGPPTFCPYCASNIEKAYEDYMFIHHKDAIDEEGRCL